MKIIMDDNIIVYEKECEISIAHLNKNKLYTLDYVGSMIFKKAQEIDCVEELIDYFATKANVNREMIEEDMKDFIYKLEAAEVIKVYEYS